MKEIDCPICKQRYPWGEIKNHSEVVHQLDRGYMDWILLLEDRLSELEASSLVSH